MTFLLGRQAIFGHAPPTYFRSIEAVLLPSLAIVQAINLPPVPLPSTSTLYFSGSLIHVTPLNVSNAATSASLREGLTATKRNRFVQLLMNLGTTGQILLDDFDEL